MPTDSVPPSSGPTNVESPQNALFSLTVDGNTRVVDPAWLADKGELEAIEQWCGTAVEPVLLTIRGLSTWPSECSAGLESLSRKLHSYAVRLDDCADLHPNLFEAMVAAIVAPDDVAAHTQSLNAAIGCATSLFDGVARTTAANMIAGRLRELGVAGVRVPTLLKEICTDSSVPGPALTDPAYLAVYFVSCMNSWMPQEDHDDDDESSIFPGLRYYRNAFWRWEGKRWKQLDENLLKAKLVHFLQLQSPEAKPTERFIRDVMTNLRGHVLVANWDSCMPLWIRSQNPPIVEPAAVLVAQNGFLEICSSGLVAGTLAPHSPALFNATALPYEFDRDAECPLWLETLGSILPSESDNDHRIDVLQEYMGYTLLSDCRYHKFLILHGVGANGKSTIMSTWEAMLGADNVSHVSLDRFGAEFHLSSLDGKLANMSSDLNHVDSFAEGVLKQLTSGEPLQVNVKFRNPYAMRTTAKLIFGTNELPTINDRSDGVWRRLIAMPFNVRFTERSAAPGQESRDQIQADTERTTRLQRELPGILNWALAGLRRLLAQDGFTACGVCAASLAAHRELSDPFGLFAAECLELRPEAITDSALTYDLYRAYCVRNGHKPLGNSRFGMRVLTISGVGRGRHGHGSRAYYYRGVALSGAAQVR
ncbi:MAG: phage/plasmid primase, P4 family [Pirellulales bacterium]